MVAAIGAGTGGHRILIPEIAVAEAARVSCPLAVACVMLVLETSGGRNVWGHDKTPPGVELPYIKGGPVTRENYLAYLELRGPDGKGPGGRQGCGVAQLTWHTLQDAADREGGCWEVTPNCRVGFRHLVSNLGDGSTRALRDCFALYNTGDPYVPSKPGEPPNYAEKAMVMLPAWQRLIDAAVATATHR